MGLDEAQVLPLTCIQKNPSGENEEDHESKSLDLWLTWIQLRLKNLPSVCRWKKPSTGKAEDLENKFLKLVWAWIRTLLWGKEGGQEKQISGTSLNMGQERKRGRPRKQISGTSLNMVQEGKRGKSKIPFCGSSLEWGQVRSRCNTKFKGKTFTTILISLLLEVQLLCLHYLSLLPICKTYKF